MTSSCSSFVAGVYHRWGAGFRSHLHPVAWSCGQLLGQFKPALVTVRARWTECRSEPSQTLTGSSVPLCAVHHLVTWSDALDLTCTSACQRMPTNVVLLVGHLPTDGAFQCVSLATFRLGDGPRGRAAGHAAARVPSSHLCAQPHAAGSGRAVDAQEPRVQVSSPGHHSAVWCSTLVLLAVNSGGILLKDRQPVCEGTMMPDAPGPVVHDVLPLLASYILLFETHGSPPAAEIVEIAVRMDSGWKGPVLFRATV
eukprot:scaffold45965_cov21-Tisochrysis_lutea.AAC.1